MTHFLAYLFIPRGTVLFWSFFNPLPSVTALRLCHRPLASEWRSFCFCYPSSPLCLQGGVAASRGG